LYLFPPVIPDDCSDIIRIRFSYLYIAHNYKRCSKTCLSRPRWIVRRIFILQSGLQITDTSDLVYCMRKISFACQHFHPLPHHTSNYFSRARCFVPTAIIIVQLHKSNTNKIMYINIYIHILFNSQFVHR